MVKLAYKSKVHKLSNKSVGILVLRLFEASVAANVALVINSKSYTALTEVNNRYQASVDPTKYKDQTEAIDAKANERRAYFLLNYGYLKGLLNAPDAEQKAAAVRIFAVMNMYGRNFNNLKIAEQSFLFNRILEGLQKPELAADLETTRLTASVAELDRLHKEYETLFALRGNEVIGVVAPSTLRPQLNVAVNNFVEELQWMAQINDTEELKSLRDIVLMRVSEVNLSQTQAKEPITEGNGTTVA